MHEQIAAHDLAGALVEQQPWLRDDVLFGAAACLELDSRVGRHLVERWSSGRGWLRSGSGSGSGAGSGLVLDAVAAS